MTRKNGNSKSQLKPKKGNKDVSPENEPKEEPPENQKTEDQIETDVTLDEAKTRVKILRSALVEIRAQIESERAEGTSDRLVLQRQVHRARSKWEKTHSDLNQAKRLSRKRKDEIDQWKAWYEKRPPAEKPAGLERLQKEIKWRADELASNGEKINILIPQEFEARGALEMAKQRLAAFRAGAHKRRIDEDPRLKSLRDELEKTVAAIDRLGPEQAKQQ